jgi:hypothetical protein
MQKSLTREKQQQTRQLLADVLEEASATAARPEVDAAYETFSEFRGFCSTERGK